MSSCMVHPLGKAKDTLVASIEALNNVENTSLARALWVKVESRGKNGLGGTLAHLVETYPELCVRRTVALQQHPLCFLPYDKCPSSCVPSFPHSKFIRQQHWVGLQGRAPLCNRCLASLVNLFYTPLLAYLMAPQNMCLYQD